MPWPARCRCQSVRHRAGHCGRSAADRRHGRLRRRWPALGALASHGCCLPRCPVIVASLALLWENIMTEMNRAIAWLLRFAHDPRRISGAARHSAAARRVAISAAPASGARRSLALGARRGARPDQSPWAQSVLRVGLRDLGLADLRGVPVRLCLRLRADLGIPAGRSVPGRWAVRHQPPPRGRRADEPSANDAGVAHQRRRLQRLLDFRSVPSRFR
jgi:hypothetical protein